MSGTYWLGLAAVVVAASESAAAPPPASQPDSAPAVMIKLVLGSAEPIADSLASEPWVAERAGRIGFPNVADRGEWVVLSDQPRRIAPQRKGEPAILASMRRDPASPIVTVELSADDGGLKRSFLLLDKVGRTDFLKVEDLPARRALFVAVRVAAPGTAPPKVWGEPVNNVRMGLRIEPTSWAGGSVKFVALFENVASSQAQRPGWNVRRTAPLEFINGAGRKIEPKSHAAGNNQVLRFGLASLPPGTVQTAWFFAEFADGTLTVFAAAGTRWEWRLPAGDYAVRAVADFQDQPYSNARGSTQTKVYSLPVKITVRLPATTQPDPAGGTGR